MPDRALTSSRLGTRPVPSKPTGFHRLPEILDVLHRMDSSDSSASAPGAPGNGWPDWLASGPATPPPSPATRSSGGWKKPPQAGSISGQWPAGGRVVEELERTRRELAARRVQIPVSPDAAHRRFGDLPTTIDLRPGELRIAFSDAEDLATRLVELSQAMAHDWSGFMRAVEE